MAVASRSEDAHPDLTALKDTPGFMIRLVQLKFFEGFYGAFEELGLTPATYAVLILVRDNPAIVPSAIAAALRMQLPNLTKILHALEDGGLVKRTRSTLDRRTIEVALTPEGERLMKEAVRVAAAYNRKMLAPLSDGERAAFVAMLNRINPL